MADSRDFECLPQEKSLKMADSSDFEYLPQEIFNKIAQNLPIRAKKVLRMTSKTIKSKIEAEEIRSRFFYWKLKTWEGREWRFLEEVTIIKGLEFEFSEFSDHTFEKLNSFLGKLMEKHPEMEELFLIISYTDAEDYSTIENSSLKCLKKLEIKNCRKLCDMGIVFLINTSGQMLEELKVLKCPLFLGKELDNIQDGLQQLKVLNLSGCQQLSDEGCVQLFNKTGSKLEHLDLRVTNLTGEMSHLIADSKLQHLKKLNLGRCEKLSDKGFVHLINKTGSKLEHLNLACTNLTGEMSHLIEDTKLQHLKKLFLSRCKQLSDIGFVHLINKTGSMLEHLDLDGTNLTGEMSYLIADSKLQHLKNLNVAECGQLSDKGFVHLINKTGSMLEHLDLTVTNLTGEMSHLIEASKLQHLKKLTRALKSW